MESRYHGQDRNKKLNSKAFYNTELINVFAQMPTPPFSKNNAISSGRQLYTFFLFILLKTIVYLIFNILYFRNMHAKSVKQAIPNQREREMNWRCPIIYYELMDSAIVN